MAFVPVSLSVYPLIIQYTVRNYTGNEDTPEAIHSRYTIIKEIGHGAYGTVYLAEDRKTQEKYTLSLKCDEQMCNKEN